MPEYLLDDGFVIEDPTPITSANSATAGGISAPVEYIRLDLQDRYFIIEPRRNVPYGLNYRRLGYNYNYHYPARPLGTRTIIDIPEKEKDLIEPPKHWR